MPEYDISFAEKLASVAAEVEEKDPMAHNARRTAVYLGRLSVEISLKALLERAGFSVSRIRARSHDLRGLLSDLGECEIQIETATGEKQWCSASCVRTAVIDFGVGHVPIGELIEADHPNISTYPNEIRYGATVIDYNPILVSQMAVALVDWANSHWNTIRVATATLNPSIKTDAAR